MATWLVRPLSRMHFRAIQTLDQQALADLAEQGSVARARPTGMLRGLLERSSGAELLFGVEGAGPGSANAYLAASQIDNSLHVEEVAVSRSLRRRGLGTALVEAAKAECLKRSLKGITLTTDRFVPGNADFYEALGFAPFEHVGWPPYLLDVLRAESEIFSIPSRRIGMIWTPDS